MSRSRQPLRSRPLRQVRPLAAYGVHTTRDDLMWFAQAFWVQSIALKTQYGWRPVTADALPRRVYEGVSLALGQPEAEITRWMDLLIDEWKTMARHVLSKFGHEISCLR